ncbi:helix-turn-helix domain-containing protein, partial [Arthrobacter sp. TMT4-20]
ELLPDSWTENSVLIYGEQFMFESSSLSEDQRQAAVALFEAGWGAKSVANRLGVSSKPIGRLYDRWRVRGGSTLVYKSTKRVFSFEFKLDVVRRALAGESRVALAKELGLSSPVLIRKWTQLYRDQGEDGLRPRAKGRRPRESPGAAAKPESELQRLRRENERLRAEVAFLGKVQALRDEERR